MAFGTYRAVERELTDAVLSRRFAISRLAAATLSERLERLISIGVALATRVRFSELVAAGRWNEAVEILERVPEDFPFIERVFLADLQGTLVADSPALESVRGQNFAARAWYRGVSRDWQPFISPVYRRAAPPQRNLFALALPVRDRDRRPTAILVLQVHLETFFDWATAVDVGAGGHVYIIDSAAQAAFHPGIPSQDRIVDLSNNDSVQRVLRGESGVRVGFDPRTGRDAVFAHVLGQHGWAIMTQQPAEAAFAARDRQLRRVVAGFATLLGLCALAIFLGTRVFLQRHGARAEWRAKAELERRVAERTEQLHALNRELESFGYSASHDLRVPLRAIDGFARMVEEDHAALLDEEGRRLLAVVRQGAAQMGRLIDELLRFSYLGRQAITAAPLDMEVLAREALAQIAGAFPSARIELYPLAPAAGDRTLLRQVWVNLIGNAFKYSARREHPLIKIGARHNGRETVYWVRDNGVGFDMRHYHKLFGVFRRLHDAGQFEGTGVGLAIVQRIVMRHGGRVWAEGKIGAGACFSFALPRQP